MSTVAFDTHTFVKELTRAGMPEEQAEVLARSQAALIDEKLATKQDLEELELALRRDLKDLELATKQNLKDLGLATKQNLKDLGLATKQNLKDLELRLTIRLGSMMVVAVGAVAALAKLL